MRVRLIVGCLAIALPTASEAAGFLPVDEKTEIQSPAITEASGIAISPGNPAFMWVVNDSGATPEIHLINTDGKSLGALKLDDAKNIDWEDLASFSLDGSNYLLVADTGDNGSKRENCTLYIVSEPALPPEGKILDSAVQSAWRIDFRYEDGPRDCESVAVDASAGKVILISKRTNPPAVYELPLRNSGNNGIQVARKIGTTAVKSPMDSIIPFRDQPTGLDISSDNTLAAIVTYYGVFIFPRQPQENWADAFGKPPAALPPHLLGQAESVAFSSDGKTIYAVSEGKRAPIRRYQR